jgi:hypothetical protein
LRAITGSAIRVEDWIGFAEYGLAVEIDGALVLLITVCLVSGSLELSSMIRAILYKVSVIIDSL